MRLIFSLWVILPTRSATRASKERAVLQKGSEWKAGSVHFDCEGLVITFGAGQCDLNTRIRLASPQSSLEFPGHFFFAQSARGAIVTFEPWR